MLSTADLQTAITPNMILVSLYLQSSISVDLKQNNDKTDIQLD